MVKLRKETQRDYRLRQKATPETKALALEKEAQRSKERRAGKTPDQKVKERKQGTLRMRRLREQRRLARQIQSAEDPNSSSFGCKAAETKALLR
jgi:hypothetical protein